MKEKVMPHNIEAEQSILGSMFLSKYALQKCLEELDADLFYLDKHVKLFETIKSVFEKGRAIDLTTVTSELNDKNLLKQVGDVEYITEIINSVPTASNVDEYIKIVVEKAILRRLIIEGTNIVSLGYDSSNDLSETLDCAEKTILNVVRTRKGTEFKKISEVLYKTQANLEKLSKSKNEVTGIPTGFYDYDRLTSGLQPNELIIVAARPAMGKTAFALNLAINMAVNAKKTVALFNMEMSAEQLANRMISSVGQIDGNKLKTGRLENNDWKKVNEAISRLGEAKIYMDDTMGMTISDLRAKCRRLAASADGLDVVIIDYLQLISGSNRYSGQRQQEVSEISRALKGMAMELEIPVIALAQLSRSVEGREDKRPLLSDLRESGSIEQDADIVAFLYREDYYNKQAAIDDCTSKSEFIIGKNRSGYTGTIDLIYKRDKNTFVNVDKHNMESGA